jgi:hypothetical protein
VPLGGQREELFLSRPPRVYADGVRHSCDELLRAFCATGLRWPQTICGPESAQTVPGNGDTLPLCLGILETDC